MLLPPEIRFKELPLGAIEDLSYDVLRKNPTATVTPINARSRPTEWHSGKAIGFRVQEDGQDKPFMIVTAKAAMLLPERASPDVFDVSLREVRAKVSCLSPESDVPGALLAVVGFIALYYYGIVYQAIPRGPAVIGIMVAAIILILAGLILTARRAVKDPQRGRSALGLTCLIPGLLALSPMCLLNLPLVHYIRRKHGQRLLPTRSVTASAE